VARAAGLHDELALERIIKGKSDAGVVFSKELIGNGHEVPKAA
jgi:hypothetical protein